MALNIYGDRKHSDMGSVGFDVDGQTGLGSTHSLRPNTEGIDPA
jgi:hypothetical protein